MNEVTSSSSRTVVCSCAVLCCPVLNRTKTNWTESIHDIIFLFSFFPFLPSSCHVMSCHTLHQIWTSIDIFVWVKLGLELKLNLLCYICLSMFSPAEQSTAEQSIERKKEKKNRVHFKSFPSLLNTKSLALMLIACMYVPHSVEYIARLIILVTICIEVSISILLVPMPGRDCLSAMSMEIMMLLPC